MNEAEIEKLWERLEERGEFTWDHGHRVKNFVSITKSDFVAAMKGIPYKRFSSGLRPAKKKKKLAR